MRKMVSYILVPTMLLLLQGCRKDKGNYTYKDINELEISDIKSTYEVLRLTELEPIIPKLASNIGSDETHYTYEWVACIYEMTNAPKIYYVMDSSRNLVDYQVSLPEGAYEVQYRVTDTNTGVRFVKRFILTVKNSLSTGWLMMREDLDGSMRMDMRPLNFGRFDSMPNVLADVGSTLPRQTGPIKICRFGDRLSPDGYAFYLINKSGADRVRNSDPVFTYDPKWNVKYNFISSNYGENIGEVTNMIYDGKMSTLMSGVDKKSGKHSVYYYNPTTQVYWAQPINSRDGGKTFFNVSREFANSPETTMGWIIFDEDSLSFYRVNSTRAGVLDIPVTTGQVLKTPYRNMGKKLKKLMANLVMPPSTTPFIYAVMKDTVANTYWLLRAFHQTMVQENWQEMSGATDIDKADLFAVGGTYTEDVYYAVGGKVYAYNISENKSFLVLDKGNETITYLNFINLYQTEILVASYNSSENIGTLERYQIQMRPNPFVFAGSRFSGVGKIVDVAYKNQ